MNQRIAMFGGTFNPIHNGHLHLAQQFQQHLQFDRILLMPVSLPPHKSEEGLIATKHRLEMCRLATEPFSYLQVSDLEIKRGGSSYTWQTLEELGRMYPGAQLHLLLGSDMYLSTLR